MVTIEPPPNSIMPGRKLFSVRKVAVRLASTVECHSSSEVCASGPGHALPPPAKAATIPTRPSSASVCSRIRSIAARSVQSAATPSASPPADRIALTTALILASSRPLTATFAPLAASSRQVAAPIPPDPPVTTATLPAKSG